MLNIERLRLIHSGVLYLNLTLLPFIKFNTILSLISTSKTQKTTDYVRDRRLVMEPTQEGLSQR